MTEHFWRLVARIVARPAVLQALYRRAEKTPYFHLAGYMNRFWVFNPIVTAPDGTKKARYPWLPLSIRLHHILRADTARDPHSHPGSFRTLIGKGWYLEDRDNPELDTFIPLHPGNPPYVTHMREEGDTAVLLNGEFHHVSQVSPGGVWTVFIMWGWTGKWGFRLPDGRVVPHQDYRNGGQP